jgi:hypothetical protein
MYRPITTSEFLPSLFQLKIFLCLFSLFSTNNFQRPTTVLHGICMQRFNFKNLRKTSENTVVNGKISALNPKESHQWTCFSAYKPKEGC